MALTLRCGKTAEILRPIHSIDFDAGVPAYIVKCLLCQYWNVFLPPGGKQSNERATITLNILRKSFEQMYFITYDAIVPELMAQPGESSDSMFKRHADLE